MKLRTISILLAALLTLPFVGADPISPPDCANAVGDDSNVYLTAPVVATPSQSLSDCGGSKQSEADTADWYAFTANSGSTVYYRHFAYHPAISFCYYTALPTENGPILVFHFCASSFSYPGDCTWSTDCFTAWDGGNWYLEVKLGGAPVDARYSIAVDP